METTTVRCIVLFEEGFWVGYFERTSAGEYAAARHIFGADLGLAEFADFVLSPAYDRLVWTRRRPAGLIAAAARNPKRRQRDAARGLRDARASSKARDAIDAERESRKLERRGARAVRRGRAADARYLLRREKRRRKRRGG